MDGPPHAVTCHAHDMMTTGSGRGRVHGHASRRSSGMHVGLPRLIVVQRHDDGGCATRLRHDDFLAVVDTAPENPRRLRSSRAPAGRASVLAARRLARGGSLPAASPWRSLGRHPPRSGRGRIMSSATRPILNPTSRPCQQGVDVMFAVAGPHWVAFVVVSAVVIAIPGPSVLFVVSRALASGRRVAL